jgi:hypothetical protein
VKHFENYVEQTRVVRASENHKLTNYFNPFLKMWSFGGRENAIN